MISSKDLPCLVGDQESPDEIDGALLSRQECQKAADIFRALGDPIRFQILSLLAQKEMCVSDIASLLEDSLPAVSQRLKLLRKDNIVSVRRSGKFSYYSLVDNHVRTLVSNVIEYLAQEERGTAN
ncbi:ArsR/SmtB family transcription factor [Polystyrenella longa]|nr:metalloregulator ArsR/SmtB family transcription factor [Polystyrenella longa]